MKQEFVVALLPALNNIKDGNEASNSKRAVKYEVVNVSSCMMTIIFHN